MSDSNFKFDKFIDDIVKRESDFKNKVENDAKGKDELPSREYVRLYTERCRNSIRYKRGKK